jgi:catechol 2,3-dioxygenase-like lactoylglutathione lyase family enzyme
MPPKDPGREFRAYVRDPDGHLFEVVKLKDLAGEA